MVRGFVSTRGHWILIALFTNHIKSSSEKLCLSGWIEFQVPPAVDLAGSDRGILRASLGCKAGRSPLLILEEADNYSTRDKTQAGPESSSSPLEPRRSQAQ